MRRRYAARVARPLASVSRASASARALPSLLRRRAPVLGCGAGCLPDRESACLAAWRRQGRVRAWWASVLSGSCGGCWWSAACVPCRSFGSASERAAVTGSEAAGDSECLLGVSQMCKISTKPPGGGNPPNAGMDAERRQKRAREGLREARCL